jgi:hypothetical protein
MFATLRLRARACPSWLGMPGQKPADPETPRNCWRLPVAACRLVFEDGLVIGT